MDTYLNAANFISMLLFGALSFAYKTLTERIAKMEENSRRDDDAVKDFAHRESEMRRADVISLHKKVEDFHTACEIQHINTIDRIAKLEGAQDERRHKRDP